MIILTAVKGLVEDFFRATIFLIIESFLYACKEIIKFLLILFLLYYFAIWSFELFDSILQEEHTQRGTLFNPKLLPEFKDKVEKLAKKIKNELQDLKYESNFGIKNEHPSLIDQLEIEVEFEENIAKLVKSEADIETFVKSEIHTEANEMENIADDKYDLNNTNRSSQTDKTRIRKKSKNKGELLSVVRPITSRDEYDASGSSKAKTSTEIKRLRRSYDDRSN